MRRIVLKTYGKIIAGILTVLGLNTSCDKNREVEYGTPSADFVVKGKVIDENTRQPIHGMAIIKKPDGNSCQSDTARTDASGIYELNFNGFSLSDVTVYASDIDGEENGSYLSDTVRIKANELKQIAKKGSWYAGKFEGEANFELKEDKE